MSKVRNVWEINLRTAHIGSTVTPLQAHMYTGKKKKKNKIQNTLFINKDVQCLVYNRMCTASIKTKWILLEIAKYSIWNRDLRKPKFVSPWQNSSWCIRHMMTQLLRTTENWIFFFFYHTSPLIKTTLDGLTSQIIFAIKIINNWHDKKILAANGDNLHFPAIWAANQTGGPWTLKLKEEQKYFRHLLKILYIDQWDKIKICNYGTMVSAVNLHYKLW